MTAAERALLEEAARVRGLETTTWARFELLAWARRLLRHQETGRGQDSALNTDP